MRKKIYFMFALLLGAGVAFLSCSKEDSQIENPDTTEGKQYKVSIPAEKKATKVVADGGVATFSTSEKVYVRNTSKYFFDANYLSPDANASHVKLVGNLKKTYEVGDILKLLYNTDSGGEIDYTAQDGTISGVTDAAIATVNVTGIDGSTIKTSEATFTNLQSIFKFTFKNHGVTLNVKSVTIVSEGDKLVSCYKAGYDPGYDLCNAITISNTTPQSTIYVALRFIQTPNDPISFRVVDENNKVYTATKNAPASGFSNSKFYTSTISVNEITPIGNAYSVSNTKQVYFSPNNLMKASGVYSFEPQHYPYEYESGKFMPYGYLTGSADADPTSFLYWSEILSDGVTSDSPKFFDIDGFSDWRVLTKAEWHYLLKVRTMLNSGVERYYFITDASNRCGLLIPVDNATTDDVEGLIANSKTNNVDYNTYIAKGLAFLPSMGYRQGSTEMFPGDNGIYWSTTYNNNAIAWTVNFYGGNERDKYCTMSSAMTELSGIYYSKGNNVRLVRDAN